MREIRIYQAAEYQAGALLALSPDAAQHVAVVLRKQVGEPLTLFNGQNLVCPAVIHAMQKKQVIVELGQSYMQSKESPLAIRLAAVIAKGDRMEWVMQKATELGVASITPLISERCVVKLDKERLLKKRQQWQSIVIAACEQSGRNQVPHVSVPQDLASFVRESQATLKIILSPYHQKNWRDYNYQQDSVCLLVGPEGGFTDEEVVYACRYGFSPLALGPRILRAETAALTALSLLQTLGGDFA